MIKVGITGHQDIGNDNIIAWVEKELDRLVDENQITTGLTCLARGADQLYAQALLKKSIPYIAIIASTDYESTFKDEVNLKNYRYLLSHALLVRVLNFNESSEEAFYNAGKTLVEESDFIIAVWNGKKAQGLGGTGDIVSYAVSKKKRVIHIDTINKLVKIISPTSDIHPPTQ